MKSEQVETTTRTAPRKERAAAVIASSAAQAELAAASDFCNQGSNRIGSRVGMTSPRGNTRQFRAVPDPGSSGPGGSRQFWTEVH